MPDLRTELQSVTEAFLDQVLATIGRQFLGTTNGVAAPKRGRPAQAPAGRQRRRAPADIEGLIEKIVGVLKENPDGLRSEALREELGVDKADLPKPLKAALEAGTIAKTGERRATMYMLPRGKRGVTGQVEITEPEAIIPPPPKGSTPGRVIRRKKRAS